MTLGWFRTWNFATGQTPQSRWAQPHCTPRHLPKHAHTTCRTQLLYITRFITPTPHHAPITMHHPSPLRSAAQHIRDPFAAPVATSQTFPTFFPAIPCRPLYLQYLLSPCTVELAISNSFTVVYFTGVAIPLCPKHVGHIGRCTIVIVTTIRIVYTPCCASASIYLLHHRVCSSRSFIHS